MPREPELKTYPQLKKSAVELLELCATYAGDGAIDTALERAYEAIAVLQQARAAKADLMQKVVGRSSPIALLPRRNPLTK